MRIDDLTERRIKEAASIVDVAHDLCSGMKKSGVEYTALCPFHDDRNTGNFMISPKKNMAKCFSCGATADPVALVMHCEHLDYPDALRWLAQKYGIFIEGDERKFQVRRSQPRPPQPEPKPLPKRLWPVEWVVSHKTDRRDTFVNWLYTLPWDAAQAARIPKVVNNYCVGHSHFVDANRDGTTSEHDFTIFWQIDHDGKVHNGHLMKYRPDGHRIKDKAEYPTTWIHARMKRAKQNPFDEEKEQASYCLFGQHFLKLYPQATVNIVESEKTAVLMSIAYGYPESDLWMACYGVGNLTNTNRLLQPLIEQGRTIVLYPDRDGVETWQKAAREIDYKRLTVNTDPVLKWWSEKDGPKADIADIVLRSLAEHYGQKPIQIADPLQEWIKKNPNVKTLIDKLNLKSDDRT